MEKELLLVLSEKAGCKYLSDLKYVVDKSHLKSELKQMPPQDFPIEQWNDAVKYLTGQSKTFDSVIKAKEFLIKAEFIKSQRA